MTQPSNYDLSQCLADVVGLYLSGNDYYDHYRHRVCAKEDWLPTKDHNQAALVKAALPYNYSISVDKTPGQEFTKVHIYDHPNIHVGWHESLDELMAISLAIEKMVKGKTQ